MVKVLQHEARAAHSGPGDVHPESAPLPLLLPDELLELLELLPASLLRHADSQAVQESRHVMHEPVQLVICDWHMAETHDSHPLPRAEACDAVQVPPPLLLELLELPLLLPLELPLLLPLLEPEDEEPLPPPSSPPWNPPVPLLDEHAAKTNTPPSTPTTSRTFITASLEGAQYGRGDPAWQSRGREDPLSAGTYFLSAGTLLGVRGSPRACTAPVDERG